MNYFYVVDTRVFEIYEEAQKELLYYSPSDKEKILTIETHLSFEEAKAQYLAYRQKGFSKENAIARLKEL